MTTKEGLLAAGLGLTENDFHNHYSDLYVVNKPGVLEWLRTNRPEATIKRFTGEKGSKWEGLNCLDIAFGYMEEYVAQKKEAQNVV